MVSRKKKQNKFDVVIDDLTEECYRIQTQHDLTDREMKVILEIVRGDYI